MSMKKIIFITSLATFFCLCYMAVKNGMDVFIGVALLTSILSNVLNLLCIVRKDEK